MTLPTLYPAQVGSPYTTLAVAYTSGESTMTLVDATKLPDAPNIVCLAGDVAGEFSYTGKDGNILQGVTALPGTPAATTWPVGTFAFRGIAAYDLNAIHENMVRTATYVVAASDAPDHVKRQADYVCDGVDDHVEIQAAIDALPNCGGSVYVSGGTYQCRETITLPDHTHLKFEKGASLYVPDDHTLTIYMKHGCPVSALITNADHVGGNTGIVIDGGYIDLMSGKGDTHTKSLLQTWAGIWLDQCTDCAVERATVENVVFDVNWGYGRGFGVLISDCEHCVVRECEGNNTGYEGIGIRGDCRHILVERCRGFRNRQHSMQASSFAPADVGAPQNVTFRECYGSGTIIVHGSHGAGAKTIKFEGCWTDSWINIIGDVRDVVVRDCRSFVGSTGISIRPQVTGDIIDGVIIEGYSYHQADEAPSQPIVIHQDHTAQNTVVRNVTIRGGFFSSGAILRITDNGLPWTVSNISLLDSVHTEPPEYAFDRAAIVISASGATIENLHLERNVFEKGVRSASVIHFHDTSAANAPNISLIANDVRNLDNIILNDSGSSTYSIRRQEDNLGYVTENAGVAASVADGGTIAHGCAATPTKVSLTGSVAGEIVTVTAIDATNITVAIKKPDGSAGTAQTVYWRAEV